MILSLKLTASLDTSYTSKDVWKVQDTKLGSDSLLAHTPAVSTC